MSADRVAPPEPSRMADLRLLAPKMAANVAEALNRCWLAGLDPVVHESVRSVARQAWLYGIGRDYTPPGYDAGAVVTQVRDPRYGWHLYALAVDIRSRARGWDDAAFFARCAVHFKACGCKWGGDYAGTFTDPPHFTFVTLKDAPSDLARALLAEGGVRAVWTEVGAI